MTKSRYDKYKDPRFADNDDSNKLQTWTTDKLEPSLQADLEQLLATYYENSVDAYHDFMGTYTDSASDETAPDRLIANTLQAILTTVSKHLPEKLTEKPEDCGSKDYVLGIMAGKNTAITEMEKILGGKV